MLRAEPWLLAAWASAFFAMAFASATLLARPTARLLEEGGLVQKNYRGRYIPVGVGVVIPVASLPPLALSGFVPSFEGLGGVWIALLLGMALLGVLDDAAGDRRSRGLRGHLRSVLAGRLTTGALKALFGVLLALYAGWSLYGTPAPAALAALTIALATNAVNLLDLRPARAIKGFVFLSVVAALGIALVGGGGRWAGAHLALALIPLGAALALWKGDARADFMLGDAGANTLGAAAGLALAGTAWHWQAGLVLLLLGLHWFAERHSLTALIARIPLLDLLDRLGRPGERR